MKVLLSFIVWSTFLAVNLCLALTSYQDPPGYPAPWPAGLTSQSYTRLGAIQADARRSADFSKSATPTPHVDFSSGPNNDQSSFFYFSGGFIFYFRLRIDGPPLALTGSSQPFTSATWNILIDFDFDGFKEFVIMLNGCCSAVMPDDIVVIYEDFPRQAFNLSQTGIWSQDAAGTNDGFDGASGGPRLTSASCFAFSATTSKQYGPDVAGWLGGLQRFLR